MSTTAPGCGVRQCSHECAEALCWRIRTRENPYGSPRARWIAILAVLRATLVAVPAAAASRSPAGAANRVSGSTVTAPSFLGNLVFESHNCAFDPGSEAHASVSWLADGLQERPGPTA